MASGFIYQPGHEYMPMLITAGHKRSKKGAHIETYVYKEGKTLCIPTGEFHIFYNDNDIDVAYSILPIHEMNNEEGQLSLSGLTVYGHEFVKAHSEDAYGFAVWNGGEIVSYGFETRFIREQCSEIAMELFRQEEHVNFFNTHNEIKTHEFYYGASGSPVADTEGQITGILIGGTEPIEHLRVFRLDNFDIPKIKQKDWMESQNRVSQN